MNKIYKFSTILLVFLMVGCAEYEAPCRFISKEKQEKAAAFIQSCVEGATSKQTGENQHASSWVRECTKTAEKVFGEDGFKLYDGHHNPRTGCRIIEDVE